MAGLLQDRLGVEDKDSSRGTEGAWGGRWHKGLFEKPPGQGTGPTAQGDSASLM